MIVEKINLTYGGKLDLGNYNSVRIEMNATFLNDEGLPLDELADKAMEQIKAAVRPHMVDALKKNRVSVEEVFMGLPTNVRDNLK